jgi:preprotein translocase subunit SecF
MDEIKRKDTSEHEVVEEKTEEVSEDISKQDSQEEVKQEEPSSEEVKEEVVAKEEVKPEETPVEESKPEEVKEEPKVEEEHKEPIQEEEEPKPKKEKFSIRKFYDEKYKPLLIIPFVMLLIAFIVIGVNLAQTGDYINKDVTLKGGVTLTIPSVDTEISNIEEGIKQDFSNNDIIIRYLNLADDQRAITITADIDGTNKDEFEDFKSSVEKHLEQELKEGEYTAEIIGSSLGDSFFKETVRAMLFAFLFMGIVVFLYFRTFIPSIAVILAAMSDIIVTLAIIDIMGMRIGTAGIAAFLMLIGYSVDTDILLSTKLLKGKEGSVFDRTIVALKTGLTMTLTTIAAVSVALILSQSEVISQIMTILLIGLIVDLINTWIQNVGILRLYLEKKHGKS